MDGGVITVHNVHSWGKLSNKKSGAKKSRKKDKLGTELRFSLDFTSSLSVGVSNLEFHFEFQL